MIGKKYAVHDKKTKNDQQQTKRRLRGAEGTYPKIRAWRAL